MLFIIISCAQDDDIGLLLLNDIWPSLRLRCAALVATNQ